MTSRSGGSRRRLVPARPPLRLRPARSWLPTALPLLLVALVLGASLGTRGGAPPSASASKSATSVMLSRTLSCVSDGPGAITRMGTVPASPAGPGNTAGYSTAPGQPGRVTFQPGVADKGYATQWASGPGWFAARACPEPADDWWFVGVGAGISHRSYLTLDNPRSNDANVTITVFGPQGQVQAPGLNDLLVPAGQSLRLDLESIAPALGDLAVHVTAVRGLVAASTWENWALSPVAPSVSTWVPGAPALANQVQLIGVPGNLNVATLLLTNPSASSVVVKVKASTATATFVSTAHPSVTVPPESTIPVDLSGLLNLGVGAVSVSSTSPITAALRTVRGNAEAYAAAAEHIGTASTVGLPGGAPMSLAVTSTVATSVTVTAIDASGAALLTKDLVIPAGAVASLLLPTTTAALRLTGLADAGVVGAVTVDNGAPTVIGLSPTANAAIVPAVIPQPY